MLNIEESTITELQNAMQNKEITSGFPSMSILIEQKENKLPVGSYWIARKFDEAMLFKVTYALEQILNARRNPFS